MIHHISNLTSIIFIFIIFTINLGIGLRAVWIYEDISYIKPPLINGIFFLIIVKCLI